MQIYKITNTKTGAVLIGANKNPTQRVKYHFAQLRAGNHNNFLLQNDFVRDGEEVFKAEVIETPLEGWPAQEREKHWIDQYESTNPDKGYNMEGVLESDPQVVLSYELAEQIRKEYGTPIKRPSGRFTSPKGISMTYLAQKYGVTVELISQILHGRVWKPEAVR